MTATLPTPQPRTEALPRVTRRAALSRELRARGRRRLAGADLLTVAAWGSAAAAVALYLADGAAGQFGSVASALTAIGIIAGLIGTDLVLVMLLLAARLPWIDRAIGHDRAMAVHGSLGKPSLYLLLAHMVFLLLGYGASEGLNPIAEAVSLWNLVPDMWLAFVSIALFIAVVVTSLVAVRRKMPYEFWHAIHLLSYAAVLTAIPHQFSVGSLFAEGHWQRLYWEVFYWGVVVALLWFRVVTPVVRTWRHQLTVSRVVQEGNGVVSIEMTGLRLHELTGEGGRFFVWRFLAPGLWWHAHPFSLSAEPHGEALRITVRNLGRGSAALARLRPGTKVALAGPYGNFAHSSRTRPGLVLVGSGIGITPIRALLERAEFAPGDATVILRASAPHQLYLREEIASLCRARGAVLYELVGRRARGSSWLPRHQTGLHLTDYLPASAPTLADSDVYVCGPREWSDAVLADAKAAGARDETLHRERFDW
ncbi:oxidoreductase [Sinomonas atrocyanea]|uniref:Oxidoreductase n=1 Tax=Sinomonas atrocyanea TaxID=37927 RepID=A0A127A6H9_9MICC|nr:ferredoxin reductase family protein [Sinomonas atrocyanea]AMM34235.1 oxidoreductase [Sinomonas atrocyanea]GEB64736.1 oxidoreductase [Sinomonas atrocyanea]GGG66600.1 oxidoreductase [Sinomonas atrocyanea]